MSGWSEEGSCNFEFWLPKIFMTEGESPSCWPHFAQTDNSREQLTAHHVKFLVCYPNYAYLPPSISDLKAHGMKCHHVEHVGNMLPFVFFPEVTSVNLFFVLRQLLCSCDFMWTCSQPKLATKLDLSQLTVYLSLQQTTSSTHTKLARTRCGNKGNRQMQWHMAAWSMLVWNAVRRMLEVATFRLRRFVFVFSRTKNPYLGGGFKHFLFSPLLGEMIQFD